MYNSATFSTFTWLCNHHLYLVPKDFHHPKGNPWDFLGGAVVKNPSANAGDMGSIPGLGRSHVPQSN